MKKIMTIFMAAAVVMTLAGCGSRTEQEADRRETGQSTSQEESRESSSAQESNSAGSSASSKEDAGIQQGEASVEVSA